ncbi:MFS transporter [Methylobacterium sp. ARG-1]|uniref:MFS transporter n=1 Tax=Methylobacterium sp. ARG-1 TaxID=1692501 RepID=UPI0006801F5D|nr:MFS transporter [Methylobacterium sp. ARG-1]KNY19116.1 MFS transporter [Methylobacterium sp. ARG-1]
MSVASQSISSSLVSYTSDEIATTYRKVTWRLVAFLFVCYAMSYLDRINVGYAQLQMKQELGFSDAVYGFGAGIFFAGYFLFEVPSNLLMVKLGARRTMMRIMIAWGLISAGMMFVNSPTVFYILRFLLGAFEAGFLPGIIFYLTYWYPSSRRARIIAIFMSAVPVAGVVGGPLSGWIMDSWSGYQGLSGWQWMFVLEGLPTVILGLIVPFILADRPADAKWLTAREKTIVADAVESDHASRGGDQPHSFGEALRDPKIYAFAFMYFAIICGVYAISFWLPTILKGSGVTSIFSIGLYSVIPYGVGAIGMVLIGSSSDRHAERRWHLALCSFVGAACLIGIAFSSGNLPLALVALSIGTASIFAGMPVFWAIPTAYLSGTAAAGGIAAINSLALIGGFVSPTVIGWAKEFTGSLNSGLYIMAALLVAGGVTVLLSVPRTVLAKGPAGHPTR